MASLLFLGGRIRVQGPAVPVRGGLVVDLPMLTRIREINQLAVDPR